MKNTSTLVFMSIKEQWIRNSSITISKVGKYDSKGVETCLLPTGVLEHKNVKHRKFEDGKSQQEILKCETEAGASLFSAAGGGEIQTSHNVSRTPLKTKEEGCQKHHVCYRWRPGQFEKYFIGCCLLKDFVTEVILHSREFK